MLPRGRKLDFVIVGAQKAGTTSLYEYLRQHKDIFLPFEKDFFLFSNDPHYGLSEAQIPTFYEEYSGQSVIGGSNVQILPDPYALDSLHSYSPNIKVIALLRNPIDRAYSAFRMMRRDGLEPCDAFEDALEQDHVRALSSEFRTRAELRYLHHGCYDDQISSLLSLFKAKNIFIGLYDDLAADPCSLTSSILEWLGVPSKDLLIDFSTRKNISALPRNRLLQSTIKSQGRWKRFYHDILPLHLRRSLNRYAISAIEEMNRRPFTPPALSSQTKHRLAIFYAPHIARLSELIDRDLNDWQLNLPDVASAKPERQADDHLTPP